MTIPIPGSSSNIGTPNNVKKPEQNDNSSDTSSKTPNPELNTQDDVRSTVTSMTNKPESKIPDERLLENTSQAVEMAEKIKFAINANHYLALDAHSSASESSVNALLSSAP